MMNSGAISWDLVRAFLAVLDGGSLSHAARALRLAQPTVRRQIEDLEHTLDAVLFTRTPTGLLPTDVALNLAPHAREMASSAAALARAASGEAEGLAGTVRVTCSEVIGAEVLPPILLRLRDAHPGIAVELVASNRLVDVLRRDADIAIRMARPEQQALVARHLGAVGLGLFAAKAYLEGHSTPATLADLTSHTLIGQDAEESLIGAFRANGLALAPRDFALRTDNDLAQLAALRAGLGIGVCQIGIAQDDPRLVRILPELRFDLDMWIAVHEDQRPARRVRAVFDLLAAELARYAASGIGGIRAGAPDSARAAVKI